MPVKSRLKKELDQMEKQGITDKLTCPTEWLNNSVRREKGDGRLYISLDPKYLNKAIKWEHHPIPENNEHQNDVASWFFFLKIK